jgi:hypothetical protein
VHRRRSRRFLRKKKKRIIGAIAAEVINLEKNACFPHKDHREHP